VCCHRSLRPLHWRESFRPIRWGTSFDTSGNSSKSCARGRSAGLLLALVGRHVCSGEEFAGLRLSVSFSCRAFQRGSGFDAGLEPANLSPIRTGRLVCRNPPRIFHVHGVRVSDGRIAVHHAGKIGICHRLQRRSRAVVAGVVLGEAANLGRVRGRVRRRVGTLLPHNSGRRHCLFKSR
jgi:hypothetical protein